MVDTGFDDFLDSDDDALFLEASNKFLECDSTTAPVQVGESKNATQQSHAFISTCFESQVLHSVEEQSGVSVTSPYFSDKCDSAVINKSTVVAPTEKLVNNHPVCKVSASELEVTDEGEVTINTGLARQSQNSLDSNKIAHFNKGSSENESTIKNMTIASASLESDINDASNTNKTPVPTNSSYINNRFTPGFTPKAKKRKLPGPAGFLELFDGANETILDDSNKIMAMDMEYENIVSSQYTPEHLSLSSWQKLQTAVSSCSNLHSTAKYYSIQRVLKESSKKKLPKHMVVPILCVLLKKLNKKGSSTKPVFMDDTGEINGKIDSEVLSTYKEFLVEGTALILKKVTFLCNVLILKSPNIVTMYHPDGTEKHPQTLESILENSEPLKPMNCECLELTHLKNNLHKTPQNNNPSNHSPSCITHSQNRFNISNTNKAVVKMPHKNNSSDTSKPSSRCQTLNNADCTSNVNKILTPNALSSNLKQSVSENIHDGKVMRSDAFLESLLDEDNCMDEFDELLGNLDEKSFAEDM